MLGFTKGVVMPISNINWFRECAFAEGWAEMALLIYTPVNESKYLWKGNSYNICLGFGQFHTSFNPGME